MVALDGLVYPGIPMGPTPDGLLDLLRYQTTSYAAQPYQQLAAAYRAAGRERDARDVLIAQQDDLYRRGALRGAWRLQHRLLRLTIGYGYKSSRALACLAAMVVVATCFVVFAAAPDGSAVQADTVTRYQSCSLVEQIGLGLDLSVPLVGAAGSQRCSLLGTRRSNEWTIPVGWLFQALGWAFATLFVAGYTGLVRKS
jgi:hypothetical protein